jgi:putative DNA primase/helicase
MGKNGVKWTDAADWMMKYCKTKGLYDPHRIRGRGAWFDGGRVVLHLGNKLIVDNKSMGIDEIKSKYIYEAEIPIEDDRFNADDILSNKEASELINISDSLSWENPINSKLYAGWIMLAPICGAIDWRPHIWITGESGTGKSWIQENITSIVLGHSAISASSNSTEAGIRQTLGNDAFPIVFDEIEAEDQDAQKRVQRILELARQASSNKNSSIIKGTAGGKSQEFIVRSPFLFSSINPKMLQQADINRVSTLKLSKRSMEDSETKFETTKELVVETITDEWSAKLRSRAIFMIPTIRKNIEIFSRIMTKILKSKRHGDQVGTLLAGAYALKSDDIINTEMAEKWCLDIDWEKETDISNESDHDKCLRILMEQLVPVNGNDKMTVGSLLKNSLEKPYHKDAVEQSRLYQIFKDSREALRKYGISTVKNRNSGELEIALAENHSMLSSLLKTTPWFAGYKHVLSRIEGAYYKTAVFGDSLRSRAIVIPAKEMFHSDEIYDNLVEMF